MYQSIVKSLIAITLVTFLLITTGLAYAEAPATAASHKVSGEAMIADVFLLRPLGLIATTFGIATFIISLPFSLPTGSADEAAHALIAKPAKWTFARPLGHVEDSRDFVPPAR